MYLFIEYSINLLRNIGLTATIVLLSACVSINPTTQENLINMSGGLLVVRIEGRYDAPPSVTLTVSSPDDTNNSVTIIGHVHRAIPGLYADYLVAIALPPKRYAITELRGLEATKDSKASQIFERIDAVLDVKSNTPDYLGRLIISSQSGEHPRLEDNYNEDIVLFRSTIPALRSLNIDSKIIALSSSHLSNDDTNEKHTKNGISLKESRNLASLGQSKFIEYAHGLAHARLDFQPVEAGSSRHLELPTQQGFQRFLKLKLPRAFAINSLGSYGMASGRDSIEKALRNCSAATSSREPIQKCHLFAVDETLIVQSP